MDNVSPVIQFTDAVVCNAENPVISGLNLSVMPGEFVYVVGKVGTGKTSLIRTLIAENPLTKGHGRVCGYTLEDIRSKDIPYLRRRLGVVFQDFQLLMDRSVADNLEFVLKSIGCRDKMQIRERIRQVLTAVGMETKAHRMPYQLSGGEQQRVAIARAILNAPELIIADEPTGNLDESTADDIMQLLRRVSAAGSVAVVMVTHNYSIVRKYPGRIFVCAGGKCEEAAAGLAQSSI